MTQAKTENTTPTPAVSTRRRFLSQAAGVAAGGSVLAVAGVSAAVAAGGPPAVSADDSALLQLEEQIFQAWWAANDNNEEIHRLEKIWKGESARLADEVTQGRSTLTHDERWQLVDAMPEAKEHDRLVTLSDQHFDRMFTLIDQMWAIPAHTEVGRESKVSVLLSCVLDWREHDAELDYRELMARRLLIDLVGGEPAKELRGQFA
jgi:hypothetical protein